MLNALCPPVSGGAIAIERDKPMRSSWLRLAVLASALVAATPALADDAKTGDDPVVATVNGLPIHRSVLIQAYKNSRLSQAPIEAVYPQLLDYVITSQLLLNEARKANITEDPEVKERVKLAQDNILEQTFLERKVAAGVEKGNAPDFVEVGEAGDAVDHAMRRRLAVQSCS